MSIDLNCDMGESFGAWSMGHDAEIMPYIHSANIACGFHAGDPHIMRKTVAYAIKHNVNIGAHPGFNDLAGFGRRNIPITAEQAYDLVIVQVGALAAVAKSQGSKLYHVKPHGALYNMSANNEPLARAIAQAVYDVDPSLVLFTLANSKAVDIAKDIGLAVKQEVFADRTYQDDGMLTPRTQAGAMITDIDESIKQVLHMVKDGFVIAQSGKQIPIQADTLCIHGDQAGALVFAQKIHTVLKQEGLI
ncbi:MAG: 5-oxoprolinase subunit PxpA [Pelistega sp.]|nr:5-oxoprolinase subunit PxpA [Pelistega sp.]